MWAENSGDLPTCLHEYRKRYLLKMSANPTISQAIERAVKLSNHVNLDSGRKRGEKKTVHLRRRKLRNYQKDICKKEMQEGSDKRSLGER